MMEDHWIRRLLDRAVIFPERIYIIWKGGISVVLPLSQDDTERVKLSTETEIPGDPAERFLLFYSMLKSA